MGSIGLDRFSYLYNMYSPFTKRTPMLVEAVKKASVQYTALRPHPGKVPHSGFRLSRVPLLGRVGKTKWTAQPRDRPNATGSAERINRGDGRQ